MEAGSGRCDAVAWLLAANLGVMLLLFVAGLAIERDGRVEARRRGLSNWLRTVLGGLALGGPWLLYFEGVIPETLLGGTLSGIVVTLAITLVCWTGYPLVVWPLVDGGSVETSEAC